MTGDQKAFRHAVAGVPGFVYRNGLSLVLVSVAWFLASLPLVTIGPATLGAYVAIQDLRSDRNQINREHVLHILHCNGVASLLFSGVPVVFGAVAVTYGVTSLQRGSIPGEIIALIAAYVATYSALALMPTFDRLARGDGVIDAARFGLGWLVHHPTPALAMGLLTVTLLALAALLTIAFVVLFAGVVFSLQVAIIEVVEAQSQEFELKEPVGNKTKV
ncbi:hypothetical protein NDI54_19435 [Haloarcula sp. S1AR25-5A]|uniref:DUF624 domain-containing protein n=1 Tax=Haloarcula terrestris TaxID=2950533 RepID=A0AAE4F277_9EURY|nr:hypothetical protein [Haloarcula terrestris]MDS0223517.1 hypothetical protein [Haloarcula terrestris]